MSAPLVLTTYKLEIEHAHTYFVGHEGVWVHNTSNQGRHQIFSLYHQFRREGHAIEDIFR